MKTLFSGMESSSKLKTTETNIGLHQGREGVQNISSCTFRIKLLKRKRETPDWQASF